MASLLELSHELLHCIFTDISPTDLSSVSHTCKVLRNYISGNKLLHKDIYLRRYDQPASDTHWEQELHHLVKLEKILESSDSDAKPRYLGYVAFHIARLLGTSTIDPDDSLNIRLLEHHFGDTANAGAFLCSSALFGNSEDTSFALETRQISAKLHCLYGVPICESTARFPLAFWDSESEGPELDVNVEYRPRPLHPYARAKVYDLRQYTDATLWGPFQNDGSQRVDWEKLEAIMVVLGYNLNKFSDASHGLFPKIWDKPFRGANPRSYISAAPSVASTKQLDKGLSRIRELAPGLDALDPYGVTGTWMRVVCFLDYNDLYAFNFSPSNLRTPINKPRPPIDEEEGKINRGQAFDRCSRMLTNSLSTAIRLIRVKWQVTKIEPPGSRSDNDDDEDEDDGLDWSNFQGERLPIVHFAGISRSLHASWDPNANSKIRGKSLNNGSIERELRTDVERGTVRQTPEGQIRWTTFSIFHGEERWRSEGVQVGGLRSARGVLGNWFDKYDPHVLWKVCFMILVLTLDAQGLRRPRACWADGFLEGE